MILFTKENKKKCFICFVSLKDKTCAFKKCFCASYFYKILFEMRKILFLFFFFLRRKQKIIIHQKLLFCKSSFETLKQNG